MTLQLQSVLATPKTTKAVSRPSSPKHVSFDLNLFKEFEYRAFESPPSSPEIIETSDAVVSPKSYSELDDFSFEEVDHGFSPVQLLKAKRLFEQRFSSSSNVFFDLCNQDPKKFDKAFFSCYSTPNLAPKEGILLPPKIDDKPTLVLDLDQTLWHISPITNIVNISKDLLSNTKLVSISNNESNVTFRPHVKEFLKWASNSFELVAYTAATKNTVDKLFDILELSAFIPESHRLCRDKCVNFRNKYVKCLNSLGRSAKRTIIVDDNFMALGPFMDQVYPIKAFRANEADDELLVLTGFLLEALNSLNSLSEELVKYTRVDSIAREYMSHGTKGIGRCKNSFFGQFR